MSVTSFIKPKNAFRREEKYLCFEYSDTGRTFVQNGQGTVRDWFETRSDPKYCVQVPFDVTWCDLMVSAVRFD